MGDMGAMAMRPALLLPEMLLFGGGLLVLLTGSFLRRDRQWVGRVLAALALVAAGVSAAAGLAGPALGAAGQLAFEGTYAVDPGTQAARLVVVLATLLVLGIAGDEVSGSARESETYALLLFGATGAVVLAGANDLLVLAVAFLLASVPLYALVGLVRTGTGAEAAMKTYLMGALFGILMLLGVTLLYGLTGSTHYPALAAGMAGALDGGGRAALAVGLLAVLAGLMFEAGGVPAHFWVPDAAQASTGLAAAFLTTVPKVGAVVAAYRLLLTVPDGLDLALLVAALAVLGMTLGNLAAYWQDDPRRLLGWSTVSQVGYLLVPVAVAGDSDLALPAALLYLAGYAVTNVTAFAVVAAVPERRDLASYRGLAGARPWLAGALLVSLLGLVGTPPTAVFVGKLTTATAAWDGGLAWLAVLVLVNTVVSLFYYLRWLVPVYRPGEPAARTMRGSVVPLPWAAGTAVVGAVLTLALGVGAGLLWPLLDGALVR